MIMAEKKKSVKKDTKAVKKDTVKKEVKAAASNGVKAGDKVKVHYTGTLDSGEMFDSSEVHGMPLEFVAGSGQMIKGFDNAVIGMKLNEEKQIRIESKEAYGDPKPEMVQKVPKDALPKEQEPEEGMTLIIGFPNGMRIPARITKVEGAEVTLDLNHPLAGKALNFKMKLVGIN
jgi:FKBP-type peptidyl-prolyl cis-trans isomerase 2